MHIRTRDALLNSLPCADCFTGASPAVKALLYKPSSLAMKLRAPPRRRGRGNAFRCRSAQKRRARSRAQCRCLSRKRQCMRELAAVDTMLTARSSCDAATVRAQVVL